MAPIDDGIKMNTQNMQSTQNMRIYPGCVMR